MAVRSPANRRFGAVTRQTRSFASIPEIRFLAKATITHAVLRLSLPKLKVATFWNYDSARLRLGGKPCVKQSSLCLFPLLVPFCWDRNTRSEEHTSELQSRRD